MWEWREGQQWEIWRGDGSDATIWWSDPYVHHTHFRQKRPAIHESQPEIIFLLKSQWRSLVAKRSLLLPEWLQKVYSLFAGLPMVDSGYPKICTAAAPEKAARMRRKTSSRVIAAAAAAGLTCHNEEHYSSPPPHANHTAFAFPNKNTTVSRTTKVHKKGDDFAGIWERKRVFTNEVSDLRPPPHAVLLLDGMQRLAQKKLFPFFLGSSWEKGVSLSYSPEQIYQWCPIHKRKGVIRRHRCLFWA